MKTLGGAGEEKENPSHATCHSTQQREKAELSASYVQAKYILLYYIT
jgi:hypothetical protein